MVLIPILSTEAGGRYPSRESESGGLSYLRACIQKTRICKYSDVIIGRTLQPTSRRICNCSIFLRTRCVPSSGLMWDVLPDAVHNLIMYASVLHARDSKAIKRHKNDCFKDPTHLSSGNSGRTGRTAVRSTAVEVEIRSCCWAWELPGSYLRYPCYFLYTVGIRRLQSRHRAFVFLF